MISEAWLRRDRTIKVPLMRGWWVQLSYVRRTYWVITLGARIRTSKPVQGQRHVLGLWGCFLWWGLALHIHGPDEESDVSV